MQDSSWQLTQSLVQEEVTTSRAVRYKTLAANQLNLHMQWASPAGTQPAPPQEPHRSLGHHHPLQQAALDRPQHSQRRPCTKPTPWPSPSPKPPAQNHVRSPGVTSGGPHGDLPVYISVGFCLLLLSHFVHRHNLAPSSSSADTLLWRLGHGGGCHGRSHRREQPWRSKRPTGPAEPQPGLSMCCLWEQNSQFRQWTEGI